MRLSLLKATGLNFRSVPVVCSSVSLHSNVNMTDFKAVKCRYNLSKEREMVVHLLYLDMSWHNLKNEAQRNVCVRI